MYVQYRQEHTYRYIQGRTDREKDAQTGEGYRQEERRSNLLLHVQPSYSAYRYISREVLTDTERHRQVE
jgi:hypothetical protein